MSLLRPFAEVTGHLQSELLRRLIPLAVLSPASDSLRSFLEGRIPFDLHQF
jgi:hypothetical protein